MFHCHHPPLSLHGIQGRHRADELRQNRARLERTLNQRPRITQSGEPAAKDLTADLKLTRYPRSLAATLAAFPSVSLFPQLGSLITRIWIGQNASTASCTACPPWREVLWECEASSHRFSTKGPASQKATRHGEHALQKSRDCGTKHNGQNLRKLRKLLSIAPAKLPQLGRFFFAAFELEYHALDVSVVLVPPQEL
jgi:hypothetical protein